MMNAAMVKDLSFRIHKFIIFLALAYIRKINDFLVEY